MTTKFCPVITKAFKKCLEKDFDKKRVKKIIERIQELEVVANEYLSSGGTDRSKVNQFGKTLSKTGNKDIYSLELGTDRLIAKIVEMEGCQYYLFYWAGSHEKYNYVIKNIDTNRFSESHTTDEISKVRSTINDLREKSYPPQDKINKNTT